MFLSEEYKQSSFEVQHLRLRHPGYSDIDIDREALDRLPEDSSVADYMLVQETETEESSPHDTAALDDDPETAAVPDLMAHDSEMDQIRDRFTLSVVILHSHRFEGLLSQNSTVLSHSSPWLSPAYSRAGKQSLPCHENARSNILSMSNICSSIRMGALHAILGFVMLFSTPLCASRSILGPASTSSGDLPFGNPTG
jgi:hypothetical protein